MDGWEIDVVVELADNAGGLLSTSKFDKVGVDHAKTECGTPVVVDVGAQVVEDAPSQRRCEESVAVVMQLYMIVASFFGSAVRALNHHTEW
jgi:hypothetical protein